MDFFKSKEWEDVKLLFEDEIEKLEKNIPTTGKSFESIGREYAVSRECAKIIANVLRRVSRKTIEYAESKISYK
jgi:uncharacterized protein YjaG (DUF416 family)